MLKVIKSTIYWIIKCVTMQYFIDFAILPLLNTLHSYDCKTESHVKVCKKKQTEDFSFDSVVILSCINIHVIHFTFIYCNGASGRNLKDEICEIFSSLLKNNWLNSICWTSQDYKKDENKLCLYSLFLWFCYVLHFIKT